MDSIRRIASIAAALTNPASQDGRSFIVACNMTDEMLQLELETAKIWFELIASEITRRRQLKAEAEARSRVIVTPSSMAKSEDPMVERKCHEQWVCSLCQIFTTSGFNFSLHLKGKKHNAKEAAARAGTLVRNPDSLRKLENLLNKGFSFWCEPCGVFTNSLDVMERHRCGEKHARGTAGLASAKIHHLNPLLKQC